MGRAKGSKVGTYGALIDKANFEKLCSIMCTQPEICGFFGVSHDTLNRWCKQEYDGKTFSEVFEEKSSFGKISLRRLQFEQAKSNPTMAIFLGKQYLGQKENADVRVLNNEDDDLTKAIKGAIGKK